MLFPNVYIVYFVSRELKGGDKEGDEEDEEEGEEEEVEEEEVEEEEVEEEEEEDDEYEQTGETNKNLKWFYPPLSMSAGHKKVPFGRRT